MTPILSATFAPPRIATKGRAGSSTSLAHEVKLLADQETGHGGQIRRDARGGSVRAMRGAEGVVDIDLGKRSKLLGEAGVLFLVFGSFFLMETDVLQNDDVAVLHVRAKALGVFADDVLGHFHLAAEDLGKTLGDGSQGVLRA